MRKPAYRYVKNKGVDQLATVGLLEPFCLPILCHIFFNRAAGLCVNSQAGLCFTWLKLGAFVMNLYVCAPTDRNNCNQVK